jgi:Zn-finger nucleic acid-binding protein/membrane protein YdbS with pleckstrin-like domain
MQCPNCQSEMVVVTTKNKRAIVDSCQSCKGLWLDSGELRAFNVPADILNAFQTSGFSKVSPSKRECPCCHVNMMVIEMPSTSTQIDQCQKCLGLFLDKGELSELANAQVHPKPLRTAAPSLGKMSAKRYKLPEKVLKIIDRDEEVLWCDKPNASLFFLMSAGQIFVILPLLLFLILDTQKSDMTSDLRYFLSPQVLKPFILFNIAVIVFLWLKYSNIIYVITNKRTILFAGIFGTDLQSIDHKRVVDFSVNVNPLDNLFGTGSISLHTASADVPIRPGKKLANIPDPYSVYKKLKALTYR